MVKTSLFTIPLLVAATFPYCNQEDVQDYEIADTEIRVSVSVPTEVEGLEGLVLTLTPAPQCPGYWEDAEAEGITPWTEDLDVDSMIFPNGDTVADGPNEYLGMLAETAFIDVVPGCYNLVAAPKVGEGDEQPALSCVVPEYTVELAVGDSIVYDLSMTCNGSSAPRPELDVQKTNAAPVIESVEVAPQATACDLVRVCATARDADFDMLEFEWQRSDTLTQGPVSTLWPTVTSHTINDDDSVTQCITVQATEPGTHELGVDVYDVVRPDPGAPPVRIEDIRGEDSHASEVAEIEASLGCTNTARSAVILMTLDNDPGMPEALAAQLIDNAIQWATEAEARNLLVVLDDNHRGEDWRDGEFVHDQMLQLGYAPDYIVEPVLGLDLSMLEAYDLVWFVNPGYELDDVSTHRALNAYRQNGGALILQGDDITRFRGDPLFMRPLTYLSWLGNGTVACGAYIDNNEGEAYTVKVDGELASSHPLTIGLAGESFTYGNDIDLTRPLDAGEQVLAWATFETRSCVVRTPAIVALDPDLLAPL